MEQIIYGDVLFAVNFSMDFLALYVTSFILKIKFCVKRATVAAIIGGVYGVISVIINSGMLSSIIFSGIIGIVMCITLNGFISLRFLVRELIVFLATNLIIGGGMTVIYEFFNKHGGADNILIYGQFETVEEQLPMFLFILSSFVVAIVLVCFGRGISRHGNMRLVSLRIEHRGRTSDITAFSDTGNLLTEPLSGQPVILLRTEVAQKLLDNNVYRLLTTMTADSVECGGEKIRFILYETISGKGMLGAFKPDVILINGIPVSGWVAISDNVGKKNDAISEAIVPACLVN